MKKSKKERRYLPSFGELIDRMTICQLKQQRIPENKESYFQEIKEIMHDLDLIIEEHDIKLTGQLIREIAVLAQINSHVWNNEANYRKGIKENNNLALSHSLNGIRCQCKNKLQEKINGRKDLKVDIVTNEFKDWEVMW